jgi:L-lactate dehydrogenase complex protein LldF
VGITGVNFGVVESGTLVLVTNEGNGRMCATLPPVHIALMGMERLLPALDDLGLMLSLLSRSATGQRITVYTQLIHSPEEGQQKHLIIVDNGRSKLQSSPLKEALYCIRCGACLNACPVFREIGGHAYVGTDGAKAPYPGPIGAVISPGLLGLNYSGLAQASTLCGACNEACPVDIDLPKLMLRVRAGQLPGAKPEPVEQGLIGAGLNAYTWLVTHSRMFAFSQRLAGFFSRLLPPYLHFPGFTGWGLSKDLPKPVARPFRDRFIPAGEKQGDSPTEAGTSPAALTPESITWPAELSRDELVEIFTTEIKALGGQVYPLMVEHLKETLIRFLRERGFQRLQVWDVVPGIPSAVLAAHGFDVRKEFAADLDAGITGALAGIAGTGTLVILGGAGQPLTASLLPPVHITVLGVEQIFSSLEQVLRLPEVAHALATMLVSGPSRTADIEMTLTIGVHGPGELHVFLVDALPGK